MPASYRPKYLDKDGGTETANVGASKGSGRSNGYEVLIMGASARHCLPTSTSLMNTSLDVKPQAFPDDIELLSREEFWIADSAATVDMTPFKSGMTDLRPAQESDQVLVGNGAWTNPTEVGSLSMDKCDNQGDLKFPIKITDVRYDEKKFFFAINCGSYRGYWVLAI